MLPILLYIIAFAVSTVSAFPTFVNTSGVEPILTVDLGASSGWTTHDVYVASTASSAYSDMCTVETCPRDLSSLSGTDLYYFNEDYWYGQYIYYYVSWVNNAYSALMYTTYYATRNNVAEIYGEYDDTATSCLAKMVAELDDEGYPDVCWYQNVRRVPFASPFKAGVKLPEYSNSTLLIKSIRIEFYDTEVEGLQDVCLSYPVEGTCVEQPSTHARHHKRHTTTAFAVPASDDSGKNNVVFEISDIDISDGHVDVNVQL